MHGCPFLRTPFGDSLRPVAKNVFPRYPRTKDHLPDGDPVGRDVMGALTGRSREAVDKWVERAALPMADGPWVGGPTWRRRTFLAWAYRNDYLADRDGGRLDAWEEGRRWLIQVAPSSLTPVRDLRDGGLAGAVIGPEWDETLAGVDPAA